VTSLDNGAKIGLYLQWQTNALSWSWVVWIKIRPCL